MQLNQSKAKRNRTGIKTAPAKGEKMKRIIIFLKDEKGAIAVEYALMVGGIAVGLISAATTLKGKIDTEYTALGSEVEKLLP